MIGSSSLNSTTLMLENFLGKLEDVTHTKLTELGNPPMSMLGAQEANQSYLRRSAYPYMPTPDKDNSSVGHAERQKYENMSDKNLLMDFFNHKNKFKDSSWSGFVTKGKIQELSSRPLTNNVDDDRVTLIARELIDRPELLFNLDNNASASKKHDGWISDANTLSLIDSASDDSPSPCFGHRPHPHYQSRDGLESQLDLQRDYAALDDASLHAAYQAQLNQSSPYRSHDGASLAEDLANQRLTGNPENDKLIVLARELNHRQRTHQAFAEGASANSSPYDRMGALASYPPMNGPIPSHRELGAPGEFNRPAKYLSSPQNKYEKMSDNYLMQDVVNHFNKLQDNSWTNYITKGKIQEVASRPLTGSHDNDNMTLMAKELLNRPALLFKLDNNSSVTTPHDGWISLENFTQLIKK
ncbi:hypothetical protein C4K03_4711 [Pseudomonas synxantha]|uniref:Uncharacterized protein n=1 Tax=Pseudomonas synxantha TaxID=47883 RepID=A0A3G7UE07_9PSED|nr:hypothetical protein [Pseudomonas synxantha]AZE56849.1 hypothetical protein C4K03_4711 [Pseudomonas synxantha]